MVTTVPATNTPCVGVCSTIYGDHVCRGCKRFTEEVVAWNTWGDAEKAAVLERIDRLTVDAMAPYFEVVDEVLLKGQMQNLGVRIRMGQPPLGLLYALLRKQLDKVADPADYGFMIRPAFQSQALLALYTLADDQFFSASTQHYAEQVAE